MKRFVSLFAVAALIAGNAMAASLVSPRAQKSGGGDLEIPSAIVETICSTTNMAGVTITATSNDPACISVAPASAVTGANGCASFTVSCVGMGMCTGSVTYKAANHASLNLGYICPGPSEDPPHSGPPYYTRAVPTVGEWGLIGLTLLMMGAAAMFIIRRRRSA